MTPDFYADRKTYRSLHSAPDLSYFRVTIGETDLHIGAKPGLELLARGAVLEARSRVLAEIDARPRFFKTLEPLNPHGNEPEPVAVMLRAGLLAGVGPMAAVAGAIAEYTGRALLSQCGEVIVENGGDVFLCGKRERTVAVFAGQSPLSGALGVRVRPEGGLGVCTSSGTVGHSLSFGKADAALIVSRDCALADAVATRFGNLIKTPEDIEAALDTVIKIPGVLGALAIIGDRLGVRGEIELIAMQ